MTSSAKITTQGLHHITAIAIDPQANLDFYTRVLGLRLVKDTVNFDAPDIYHFYYGDHGGNPGTILTFFPFTYAARGRAGAGMAETVSFAVPEAHLDTWMVRLAEHDIDSLGPFQRFGEPVLRFTDPDGMPIELIGASMAATSEAILGFHAVSLRVEAPERTIRILTEMFGYEQTAEAEDRRRFSVPGGAKARHIDIECRPGSLAGQPGGGTIHHIAFRAKDDAELAAYREVAQALGLNVTPILDRQYFHSIYFREPGGVLFEVATDPPGFAVDEPLEALGTSLKLPPRYEALRDDIVRRLPPVILPTEREHRP